MSSRSAVAKIGLTVASILAATSASRVRAADATSPSYTGPLEEVIVTSRKREENLQDVPVSIEVFTQKEMQNLAINGFEDYAQKVPSISYNSTGPGTQVLVMRGASDGSNPNYANTSATGVFLDDISLSYSGAQPDLHLYDIAQIEVLNGPQGTTFGAGAMAGAIRYITNKPDVHSFSAGLDVDVGKINGADINQTYEAFLNAPLIDGILGLRLSAFSDSHGGFINNRFTTRTWVNGAVSDNGPWARNNYNREHVEGGRAALRAVINDKWSASLTYSYQRQKTQGAWDEDPTLPARTVERFGPESNNFQAKLLDFHVDGDVGIGDLVFASTYWSLPRRQWNEYSQYEENFNAGAKNQPPPTNPPPQNPPPPKGFPGTQEGFTCLDDPYYGTAYAGCNAPVQYYSYWTNPERWADELRLSSKPGGRFHWLVGTYWEKTRDKWYGETFYMPGLQYQGSAFQSYLNYYGLTQPTLPAGQWYAYSERSDYLQTTEFANISFDVTDRLNVEAGTVHFRSHSSYYTPFVQFAYYNSDPSTSTGGSKKWNSKLGVNYKIADHILAYANFSQGFRDGGTNAGDPQGCYKNGVPYTYTPDTLNNYELGWKSTTLNGRLLWNGAAYFMDWNDLQTLIYDAEVCPSASYNINIGKAHIKGAESNVSFKVDDHLTLEGAASYTDSHIVSASTSSYQQYVGERLPFAPYFSWSWNARYELPLGTTLHGYGQFDMAHKGDMWNGINPTDKNSGLPRVLQPAYTLMNLRFGLTPEGGSWLAEFYITNLTDKNAIVYSNTGNFDLRLTTNEPRVFGLRVNYRFGTAKNSE